MDVNLLRAILWAQAAGRRNRQRPWLVALMLLATLPLACLTLYGGWLAGLALPRIDALGLGRMLVWAPLGWAVASAIWDGTPVLGWSRLRPFLVPPWALLLAELVASLLTPFRKAQAALLGVFCVGVVVAQPRLWLWITLQLAMGLVVLVCLERLVGRWTRQAGQRVRLLALLVLCLPGVRWLMALLADVLLKRQAYPWKPHVEGLPSLPGMRVVEAWQSAIRGAFPWGQGLVEPLIWTLGLVALTYWVLRPELRETGRVFHAGGARPWSFSRPWVGVAKQQWHSLWRSKQGRFYVFLPLGAPLLMVDPMLLRVSPGPAFLVGAAGWMMLALGGLACNLFGLDRGGVRTFWLLPLEDRDLLLGKLVGHAAYGAVTIGLLMGVLGYAMPMPPGLLPASGCFCLTLCVLQLHAGLHHSLDHPRPLDPLGLNPSELDEAQLRKLGRLLLPWLVLVVLWLVGGMLGRGWLTGVMATALGSALGLLVRAWRQASARLPIQRERVTMVLSGASSVNPGT